LQSYIRLAAEKVLRKIKVDFDQPDWTRLEKQEAFRWQEAVRDAQRGPKVLIATSTGGQTAVTTIESLLAVALTLRGAEVHLLLCDEILPACLRAVSIRSPVIEDFVKHGPQKTYCWDCFNVGKAMYKRLGLPIHRYSEFISPADAAAARQLSESIPASDIGSKCMDGLAVGEHAVAGTLRFFARGTLDGEPQSEGVLRRYFEASLLTTFAIRKLLERYKYACACFNHGIYVPQGLIGEVARQKGVRVVNWNPAYRKKRFIFSHGDTYHHTLLTEPTAHWENMAWNTGREAELLDYLKSRWQGTRDWIRFNDKPQEDLTLISRELGINFSRPTVGMLTNVMWDAQLHYRANAFPNMLEWVLQTIRYFGKRPDLQLLIRVHPAEVRGQLPSRQPIIAEIKNAIQDLPSNVFLVPPESRISTYAAMTQTNAVIIYGTKTGVELTSLGIPIIVAGEAWIRNKGVTYDTSSPEEYFRMLDALPFREPLDEEVIRRGRKYAFHFFFRRMIPIKCIEPTSGRVPYKITLSSLDDLLPGKDPGLDIICDGILHGAEFSYPAELYPGGD